MGTLTRRIDLEVGRLSKEFKEIAHTTEEIDSLSERLKRTIQKNTSDKYSKYAAIYRCFADADIDVQHDQSAEYYMDLGKEVFKSHDEQVETAVREVFQLYKNYPAPEYYLKRLVDCLCCENDGWQNNTLRLRILRQFIKYGDCLVICDDAGAIKDRIYGGDLYIKKYLKEKTGKKIRNIDDIKENISFVEDDVFNILEGAEKEEKKPTGKYGILKMTDDLANSKFKSGGATKKSLYLFAMVFGMTFYSGDWFEEINEEKDIEINLFRNYYTNNLIRFISEDYINNVTAYEKDPSGQGINYKNFAEIIYLYYISKPGSQFSASEKIRSSSEMIERVKKQQLGRGKPTADEDTEIQGTFIYRANVRNDEEFIPCGKVFSKSEEEFEKFICENYNCDTSAGKYRKGEMELETEQYSAYEVYEYLLGKLREPYERDSLFLKKIKNEMTLSQYHREGLWFASKEEQLYNLAEKIPEEERTDFKKFIEVLIAFNDFVSGPMRENGTLQDYVQPGKGKALHEDNSLLEVNSPDKITRTAILVAYYYYFNSFFDGKDNYPRSFAETYAAYLGDKVYGKLKDVNKFLTEAYYQPINNKNLFDVLLVFSSFYMLNER